MSYQSKNNNISDLIRREVRAILLEQDEWDGYMSSDNFTKLFVAPFTNVLKTAQVAIKDVLTSTINLARQVVTFDLKKKRELEAKYRAAKEKINQEYEEVMKPIDAALGGDDAKMLAFALNPGGFVASALAKGALDTGQPILDYAKEKLDLVDFRDDDGGGGGGGNNNDNKDKGPLLGLMHDLNKIFFSPLETAKDLILASDDALDEQENEDKGPKEKASTGKVDEQALEIAKVVLQDMGIWESVQAAGEERLKQKLAEIKELEAEFGTIMKLIEEFKVSETVAQAKQVSTKLNQHGLDLSQQVSAVEGAVQEQLQKLEQDATGELKAQLLQAQSPLSRGLTKESAAKEFLPLIEKTILASAVQGGLEGVREDMFKQIMGFVSEGMTKSQLRELAASSPTGKKFSDAIFSFASRLANK